MTDIITEINGSIVQHGSLSNRIYLMKLKSGDINGLLRDLNRIALDNSYTKIFAKIPANAEQVFSADGYRREAYVPKFYKSAENACFMGKYFDKGREQDPEHPEIMKIINLALKKEVVTRCGLPDGFNLFECEPGHAPLMANLYKEVFVSYPFPVHTPEYIIKTMHENIRYYAVRCNERLVALSSAEMDTENLNAEMTDFATLPEFRGYGLSLCLLQKMESEMREIGIQTLYTIARALSPGMNITFAKAGYGFGGTLVMNTGICGRLESMNVWYRHTSLYPIG